MSTLCSGELNKVDYHEQCLAIKKDLFKSLPRVNVDLYVIFLMLKGAPVAQWVKRWPPDPAVTGLIPTPGENLPNCKGSSTAHSLSLSSYHHRDITEILKYC